MAPTLSERVKRFGRACRGGDKDYGDILLLVNRHEQALVTLICGIICLVPIPLVPGITILFGLMIVWGGAQIAREARIWLPNYLARKKVHAFLMGRLLKITSKALEQVEPYVRPRASGAVNFFGSERVTGTLIAFGGLLLALPLPPPGNMLPAAMVVLLSLAVLEDDGVCALLGYVMLIVNFVFLGALFVFGKQLVDLFL